MEAHISVYIHRYSHIEHINSLQGVDMRRGTYCLWNAEAHCSASTGGFGLGCVSCGIADDTGGFPEIKTNLQYA